MTRNQATFIALGSPAAKILEELEDLLYFECGHDHKPKCTNTVGDCGHEEGIDGLEEAAVAIADMITKGELK